MPAGAPSWAPMPAWVAFVLGAFLGFALGVPVAALAQAGAEGAGGSITIGAGDITIPAALLAALWHGVPVRPVEGTVWPASKRGSQ